VTKSLNQMTEADAQKLSGPGGPLAMGWCRGCDKSHHHCRCATPQWCTRADGKLGPLPGQPGGPIRLSDMLGRGVTTGEEPPTE